MSTEIILYQAAETAARNLSRNRESAAQLPPPATLKEIQRKILAIPETDGAGAVKPTCTLCRDRGHLFVGPKRELVPCGCVARRRSLRLMQRNGFDPEKIKSLDEYLPANREQARLKTDAARFITSFRTGRTEEGMMLCGQQGSGKTHVAKAIAMALIMRSRSVEVLIMRYIETLRQLKTIVLDGEAYDTLFRRYAHAELLIIEDMYKDRSQTATPLSETDVRHLRPIIDHRYENGLPTIVTTELIAERFHAVEGSIGGRLLQKATYYEITGAKQDKRISEFLEKRQQQLLEMEKS